MVHRPDSRWSGTHWPLDQVLLAMFMAAAGACTLAWTGEPSLPIPFDGEADHALVVAVRFATATVDFALAALLLAWLRGLRSRSPLVPVALGFLIVLAALAPAVEAIVAAPYAGDASLGEPSFLELANFGPAGSCIIVLLAAWRPLLSGQRRHHRDHDNLWLSRGD